jgi:hypothetical protein
MLFKALDLPVVVFILTPIYTNCIVNNAKALSLKLKEVVRNATLVI